MEPAEYELEIKKLVAQDKGGGDDISEDDASIKSSAAVIGTQSKAKEVVVDLRGCACTNIQAKVCVEMVPLSDFEFLCADLERLTFH